MMDTCMADTPRKSMRGKMMRLRPVLEHRMPTLATKAAFALKAEEPSALPATGAGTPGRRQRRRGGPAGDPGLVQLMAAPPRSMRDVRAAVTKELKSVTRKVARLEREYYGDRGTVHTEVDRYAFPVKTLMKTLWILDLNKASEVEEMLRQTSNPERYKGDPQLPAALREVFSKVQAFLPDRVPVLVEACQTLLDNIHRYCVSFYDPDEDCYLETPAHYSEQQALWKARAEHSIQSARSLYRKFCTTGITLSMLSSPVATFCSRSDITKLLFLALFADACTHMRSALSVLTLWLKTDDTYASYVKNDLAELEKQKEEKMKELREVRQKCHTLTYSLTKQEADHSRLTLAVDSSREKANSLRIEEVGLVNMLNDIDLEIEFKEKRRENLKKKVAAAAAAAGSSATDGPAEQSSFCAESYDSLTSELKGLKDRQPGVAKSLGQVRVKLAQVDARLEKLDKAGKELVTTRRELLAAEEERHVKEQEFSETEEAAQLARKILLHKTASDATEKLFYSVPFASKVAKGEDKDPISQACKIISARVDKDWVSLYRHLPFHPPRGQETIERDIVHIRDLGARASMAHMAVHALERWKRHHTRANVQDLRQALRQVRRFDILKVIDEDLKSPTKEAEDPFEVEEETPPVKPELLPFYRLVERYDQLRASKVKQ
ncbi:uncharacterized protein LOC143291888 isoform X2 [Babylonia areolata]|uniref:uncharacterized protein LOC143291888 isoform X2 n=1 Tax=Babylonia areolata TaxID=304850 RepID=UPI003FD2F4EF